MQSVILLMLAILLGCAASEPAQLQLPADARIGILNLLERQMTHVDVGTFRIDGFTRLYPVDWDIPGQVARAIENELTPRGNFTFVPVAANAPSDWRQSTSEAILSTVKGWAPADLKAFLQKTAEENRLDAVISASSYPAGMWEKKACFEIGKAGVVNTNGYGLFTRTRALSGLSGLLPVGKNMATPYANIIVAVFQTRPVKPAAYGAAPCSKSSLSDFPWDSDLRKLDPSVIDQVRPHVERICAEAVHMALGKAGLVP